MVSRLRRGARRQVLILPYDTSNTLFLLQFRNKHHEYSNFCVQLAHTKFQILTKKINIEILLVAH